MSRQSALVSGLIWIVAAGGFLSTAEAQFSQQGGKLTAPDAGPSAGLGSSAAVSADGITAIVGAPGDNGQLGAAFIFARSGDVWMEQAKLVGTGSVGSQVLQGTSVGISGDGNTVIVGGYADNSLNGAAWIFTRSGGVWTQQGPKLVGTGVSGRGAQGSSVGLSGDGNTAIIGGPSDAAGVGAVWVFTRTGTTWSQQGGKLTGIGALGAANQGAGVALSGDGNTAIVGGPNDNAPDANSAVGAIWVYTRVQGVWTQQGNKLVVISNGAVGAALGPSRQGWSVAVSADGNTAVAGGRTDNGNVGAAWVWSRGNNTWTQQAKLVGTDVSGLPLQGTSVSVASDGSTAVVGGFNDNGGAGAMWVFKRSAGVWTQQGSKLVGSGGSPNANQGSSVSISSDGLTAISGGPNDGGGTGAFWAFATPQSITPLSVDPAFGSASSGVFTFKFIDPNGYQNLSPVDVIFNNVLDGRSACYIAIVPSGPNSASVFLVDNAGDAGGPFAGLVVPGFGSVSNNQCTINAAASAILGTGDTLTVTLALSFSTGFAGSKVVYMSAQDGAFTSGWQALGFWQVPGGTPFGPSVNGMTPPRSSGSGQTYTFNYNDSNGWQDLSVVNVLINTALNGIRGCYVAFAPTGANSGLLYLVDDAGDAGGPFAGGLVLPGSGTISNGQCTINGSGSSVNGSGNSLSLSLAMSFSGSFSSNRIVYEAARSASVNSGWQVVGTIGQ